MAPTLDERPGPHQVTVSFAGNDLYDASSRTTSLDIAKEDSDSELTIKGSGNNRTVTAHLADRDTPSDGIVGRTADFYVDSELIGSTTTNDEGVASAELPPRYRGGSHDFEFRFEGDDYYLPSSDFEQT